MMMMFEDIVKEFNTLVQQYKFVDALDKFYDDNVISADNDNPQIKGKENLRKAVASFLENIQAERLDLKSSMVEDNLSVAHWHYTFTHKKFGTLDYDQISVQRWKEGRIIQEHHFYNL